LSAHYLNIIGLMAAHASQIYLFNWIMSNAQYTNVNNAKRVKQTHDDLHVLCKLKDYGWVLGSHRMIGWHCIQIWYKSSIYLQWFIYGNYVVSISMCDNIFDLKNIYLLILEHLQTGKRAARAQHKWSEDYLLDHCLPYDSNNNNMIKECCLNKLPPFNNNHDNISEDCRLDHWIHCPP